ncbi:LysR family transcriptional regulator [Nocardioides bizhenqiangii]|uniref:LysR family transcriptional regulator n=1 Tax=Nocardioides bizhenqiangii TaxID=3095076 RepID=A0ABZ0ZLV9_9ACTN|nr:LysR family transcriptional regulator [Nocardioides sp. HM61]WQQ25331.1 LysR family transcriptional regulator [Nocardioides sp. HM61]
MQLRVIEAIGRLGSVTAAAKDLYFSQPSLSHHVARLEAETGAQLLQRVGRGIRLTEAGQLLADRASEIVGRVDAAEAELTALVGLDAGRVRLAGFGSVMSSLVPVAAGLLVERHPGLELELTDTHPEVALRMLRAGEIEVAVIFRYDESEPEEEGVRLVHLLDDPLFLLSLDGATTLKKHRTSPWIGGCERCRTHLEELCESAGFTPSLTSTTDDSVVMQSMVAAGLGVTTIPGLALAAHRNPQIRAEQLSVSPRRIYAATYGNPPDPPATRALITALGDAAESLPERSH